MASSDILGAEVIEEDRATGEGRVIRFITRADLPRTPFSPARSIRIPPKTQAALLRRPGVSWSMRPTPVQAGVPRVDSAAAITCVRVIGCVRHGGSCRSPVRCSANGPSVAGEARSDRHLHHVSAGCPPHVGQHRGELCARSGPSRGLRAEARHICRNVAAPGSGSICPPAGCLPKPRRALWVRGGDCSGFYRFLAIEQKKGGQVPADDLRPPVRGAALPKFLSLEEVDRLLAQPDTATPRGLRDKALIEVAYATGLRVSELVALRAGDLNLDEGYLTCIGKGDKQRMVPLGHEAVDWVRRAHPGRPHRPRAKEEFTVAVRQWRDGGRCRAWGSGRC